jgi:broad specificity phosphatase PhoE
MAKRLVLVRHARVDTDGRLVGATDVPLDAIGRSQSQELAERLGRYGPGACYCSPMQRCLETARAASPLPLRVDPDLREIDFGRWENRTFAEAVADSPETMKRWAAFDPDFAFPQGESVRGFLGRVQGVAKRLAGAQADVVAAVTHGGVIRTMLCELLGIEPRHYAIFDVPFAGIAVIDLFQRGGGVLAALVRPEPREDAHG